MSAVLSAKRICEEALGAIGAFPVTESSADPEQLRRAMTWLDLIMAQAAGTMKVFTLIPANLAIPITNGTQTYNLNAALGSDLPVDHIQFPVEAWLQDQNGNRSPIEIVTREKFEAVERIDETGLPCRIYIDRITDAPTLKTFPTPSSEDTNTYTLYLVVQTYAPNVGPAGVTGAQPDASVLHKFSQAWQRWLILALSVDLGGGPIIKLPQASLNNWKVDAAAAKKDLEAFENREHDTEEPICEPWGM